MAYKTGVDFQCRCQFLLRKGIGSFWLCLQIHKRIVNLKMDLGCLNRVHPHHSDGVTVASFVLCVRVCMHAREGARARSHVGLVCTGCLVTFLVVCWSYCNSAVVVCFFADKSWPLLSSTVRLYSFLNCELINSPIFLNESSLHPFLNRTRLMALTRKSLMFCFTEILHTKMLQVHSSTSELGQRDELGRWSPSPLKWHRHSCRKSIWRDEP